MTFGFGVRWPHVMTLLCASCLVALNLPLSLSASDEADRITLAVDALTRLEGVDLEANQAMKERVLKVLEKTRGTPNFVRLVRHFRLPNQETGLLEVAAAAPADENGVEAIRMILATGKVDGIRKGLAGPEPVATKLAEALGNSGQKDAVPLLRPILAAAEAQNSSRGLKVQAVRSLAHTHEGARALLALAQENRLSTELKELAATELRKTRWADIKAEAARISDQPTGSAISTLPPIAELLRVTGDVGRGEAVYARPSPGCIACHVVRGQGTELGPNLSEIGSKLGKDALYQAILEPSAGISFGFEAFSVTTKDGEEAYGLIASETAEELVLKVVGGVTTRLKKSEIVERKKSTLSMMPAGLEAGMTAQELIDLVEYLASLKKPN